MSHSGHGGDLAFVLAALVIAATCVYVPLALFQQRLGKPWSRWRIAAWVSGSVLLLLGLSPSLVPYPSGDFRAHMLSHLLLGMIAPLGLVLSAPVTLLLSSVPRRAARAIVALLRTRFVRFISRPFVALVLNVGGMAVLYFTPLYQLATAKPWLHHMVQVHFILAGYLFAWVIAGPDPAPRRPGVFHRLVVLGVAIVVHATLAQLMYAGAFVAVEAPIAQLRGGAELMYYGGDIADLLLALAMVSTWRHRRRATDFPCIKTA